jgi:hypothetical protein
MSSRNVTGDPFKAEEAPHPPRRSREERLRDAARIKPARLKGLLPGRGTRVFWITATHLMKHDRSRMPAAKPAFAAGI